MDVIYIHIDKKETHTRTEANNDKRRCTWIFNHEGSALLELWLKYNSETNDKIISLFTLLYFIVFRSKNIVQFCKTYQNILIKQFNEVQKCVNKWELWNSKQTSEAKVFSFENKINCVVSCVFYMVQIEHKLQLTFQTSGLLQVHNLNVWLELCHQIHFGRCSFFWL